MYAGLNAHNYSSYALPLTGGTLSGNVTVQKSDAEADVYVDYTGENAHKGSLTVTVNGTFGLYDRTKSKWVVYSDKDGNVNLNGNASTATKLASAVKIDGISFDGSADITHYGTCATGASTKAKVVTCAGFTLVTGARIYVKFTNAQPITVRLRSMLTRLALLMYVRKVLLHLYVMNGRLVKSLPLSTMAQTGLSKMALRLLRLIMAEQS